MADGDTVTVELIAKVDGLVSGLAEATAAMRDTAAGMSGGFKATGEAAHKHDELMHEVLSGALFLEFKEIATEALEAVKESFEKTVGAAEEFGLSNEKFSRMMHVSETDAAAMSAALKGVGSSAGAYESISLRLQKTLENSKTINADLANAMKGPNGEALSGAALMDRLKEALASYSEEGQNAAVVQLGLGRRASDLYDIMRVGTEQVERQKEIYASMGVETEGAGAKSRELEDALNDLNTTFSALWLSIGQQLMPTAKAMTEWLTSSGPEFKGFADTAVASVKKLVVALAGLDLAIKDAVTVMGVAAGAFKSFAQAAWDSAKSIGQALYDLGPTAAGTANSWKDLSDSGDRTAKRIGDASAQMKADWGAAMAQMTKDGEAFQSLLDAIDKEREIEPGFEGATKGGTGTRQGKSAPTVPGTGGNPAEQMAMERIQAAEKMQLALIALQEQTDAHLLAMGQEGLALRVAQETNAENSAYAVKAEALDKELALQHKKPAERQKILDQIVALEQEHQGKLTKIEEDAQSSYRTLASKQLADSIRDDNERLKSETESLKQQYEAGKIGAMQFADMQRELTKSIKEQELARLDADLETLDKTSQAWEAAYRQREKVARDFNTELAKIQLEQTKNVEKDVGQWAGPMAKAFESSLNDMLLHGKTFADSMKALGQGILSTFVSVFEQIAERFLVLQITNALVARTTQAASAAAQIQDSAAVAGAAAFASTAAIPIVGLAAAPGAAAAAVGATMSFDSLLAFAGGGMVPDTGLAMLHKQEMVLPANIAQAVVAGAGAGGGGRGDVNLHYSPSFQSGQEGLGAMLQRDSGAMRSWLVQQARNGSLRGLMG